MNATPERNSPALEFQDVGLFPVTDRGHGRVTGIDWHVRCGDLWVLAGTAASGKSQLLATAGGLMDAASGGVKWFGEPAGLPLEVELRKRIGLVHGGAGRQLHWLTVEENIALPMAYHENLPMPVAIERTMPLLEFTGIRSIAGELPAVVPRHLKPRVELARALSLAPQLLLLDNPAAGLDFAQARWWMQCARSLIRVDSAPGNQPCAVVIAVDDLRPWRRCGGRFACLHDGQWMLMEDLEQSIRDGHPALRDLLALESMAD